MKNRDLYISYIYDHVNEIRLSDRVELYKILLKQVSLSSVIEKANGVQIHFSNIHTKTLHEAYDYLRDKIENNKILI
jgi:hypothetical protein